MLHRLKIVLLCSVLPVLAFTQQRVKPVMWFGPSDNVNVCGLNVAPLMFRLPSNSNVNGLNIEGIGIPIFAFMVPQDPVNNLDSVIIGNDFNVSGVSLSPAGFLQNGTVKGVAITSWFSIIDQVNGVSISLLGSVELIHHGVTIAGYYNSTYVMEGVQIAMINTAKSVKGVQLGIVNRTTKLEGLQIGIWNINERRKFPIFNW